MKNFLQQNFSSILHSLSSRGGLGVELLLHKKNDSAPEDQSPIGAMDQTPADISFQIENDELSTKN